MSPGSTTPCRSQSSTPSGAPRLQGALSLTPTRASRLQGAQSLTPSGAPRLLGAQSSKHSEYVIKAVGNVLVKCLKDIIENRPADPIDYMAQWLYKYTDNQLYFYRRLLDLKEAEMMRLQIAKINSKRAAHLKMLRQKLHIMKDESEELNQYLFEDMFQQQKRRREENEKLRVLKSTGKKIKFDAAARQAMLQHMIRFGAIIDFEDTESSFREQEEEPEYEDTEEEEVAKEGEKGGAGQAKEGDKRTRGEEGTASENSDEKKAAQRKTRKKRAKKIKIEEEPAQPKDRKQFAKVGKIVKGMSKLWKRKKRSANYHFSISGSPQSSRSPLSSISSDALRREGSSDIGMSPGEPTRERGGDENESPGRHKKSSRKGKEVERQRRKPSSGVPSTMHYKSRLLSRVKTWRKKIDSPVAEDVVSGTQNDVSGTQNDADAEQWAVEMEKMAEEGDTLGENVYNSESEESTNSSSLTSSSRSSDEAGDKKARGRSKKPSPRQIRARAKGRTMGLFNETQTERGKDKQRTSRSATKTGGRGKKRVKRRGGKEESRDSSARSSEESSRRESITEKSKSMQHGFQELLSDVDVQKQEPEEDIEKVTWTSMWGHYLVCEHPYLGDLLARPPIMSRETPDWWEQHNFIPQTLYDHEIFSRDNDDIIEGYDPDNPTLTLRSFVIPGPFIDAHSAFIPEIAKDQYTLHPERFQLIRVCKKTNAVIFMTQSIPSMASKSSGQSTFSQKGKGYGIVRAKSEKSSKIDNRGTTPKSTPSSYCQGHPESIPGAAKGSPQPDFDVRAGEVSWGPLETEMREMPSRDESAQEVYTLAQISPDYTPSASRTKRSATSPSKKSSASPTKKLRAPLTKKSGSSRIKIASPTPRNEPKASVNEGSISSVTRRSSTSPTKISSNSPTSTRRSSASLFRRPNTSGIKRPNTSEIKRPNTSETKRHSTSETKRQSTSETKRHSTSETKRHSTSETKRHSTSETKRHSTSETKRHSTSETKRHSTSEIKRPNTSETKRYSTSEIKRPNTSETKRYSTSETKRHSTSETKRQSTSETRRSSASETKGSSASETKRSSASAVKTPSAPLTREGNAEMSSQSVVSGIQAKSKSLLTRSPGDISSSARSNNSNISNPEISGEQSFLESAKSMPKTHKFTKVRRGKSKTKSLQKKSSNRKHQVIAPNNEPVISGENSESSYSSTEQARLSPTTSNVIAQWRKAIGETKFFTPGTWWGINLSPRPTPLPDEKSGQIDQTSSDMLDRNFDLTEDSGQTDPDDEHENFQPASFDNDTKQNDKNNAHLARLAELVQFTGGQSKDRSGGPQLTLHPGTVQTSCKVASGNEPRSTSSTGRQTEARQRDGTSSSTCSDGGDTHRASPYPVRSTRPDETRDHSRKEKIPSSRSFEKLPERNDAERHDTSSKDSDPSTSSWHTLDSRYKPVVPHEYPELRYSRMRGDKPSYFAILAAHTRTATTSDSTVSSDARRHNEASEKPAQDYGDDPSDSRSDTSCTLRGIMSLDDSQRTLEYEASDEELGEAWEEGENREPGD